MHKRAIDGDDDGTGPGRGERIPAIVSIELMDPNQPMMHTLRSVAWPWLMRPRTRAWLLAGFLAVHLALTVPLAILAVGWDWPEPDSWFQQLSLDREGSAAALYSGVLWGTVAALAAAQLFRPALPIRGPRWLWALGWLSAALIAALVAFEELADLKDTLGRSEWLVGLLASVDLRDLPVEVRWAAVVAPLAAPLAAAAGWVLYASLRRHPALALLAVLALALGVGAVLHDGFAEGYGTTGSWLLFLDDGSEVMAGAILAVVLVEALAARHSSSTDDREHRGRRHDRWAAIGVMFALLGVGIAALLAEHEWEEVGWTRPVFYAGPVTLLEQPFQTHFNNLSRVAVWGYVDGGDAPDATAEVVARLILHGGGPVAETRAEMRGSLAEPEVNDVHFEPIPDSGGKQYTLAISAPSDSRPLVFIGITGGAPNLLGGIVVNGVRHERQIAMGTHALASGVRVIHDLLTRDPRRLFVISEIVAMVFLWVFAAVAAWGGLSGPKPRFWRGFVWRAAQRSLLITAGIAAIALALLQIF